MAYGFLLAALLVVSGWTTASAQVQADFQTGSKLWLDGTSSLHDWKCETPELSGYVQSESTDNANVVKVEATIPVEALDCGNAVMTKRTIGILKSNDSPNVQYKLVKATPVPGAGGEFKLQTTGQLTIAGVTKDVAMEVQGKKLPDGRIQYTGSTPLLMTNYGIKPPAFLNLKTGDEVTVHFEIIAAPK